MLTAQRPLYDPSEIESTTQQHGETLYFVYLYAKRDNDGAVFSHVEAPQGDERQHPSL